MKIPTVTELEAALRSRGHYIVNRPWMIHLVVLRRKTEERAPLAPPSGTLDAFDDMLCITRYRPGRTEAELFACRCTADPGKPSRENPTRKDGTAVWALGQLVDGLKFGTHGDEKYKCYTPAIAVPVLRFTGLGDMVGQPSTSWTTQLHRASKHKETFAVGPYSVGCIVTANPKDYETEIAWGEDQVRETGHAFFSVTVMEWS